MATIQQKQHWGTSISTAVITLLFIIPFILFQFLWEGKFTKYGIWLAILIVIVAVPLVLWINHLLKPLLYHDNNQLSRLIYQVKLVESGKEIGREKAANLKKQFLAFAKANPDLEGEAFRYLGDLAFAMRDTEEALRHYAEVLNRISPESEDYPYLINRSAAGLLRVGNFQIALKEFKYIADINPFYSVGLGAMYEFGWGVERDLKKSCLLYEQASRNGNDLAVINLYENRWRKEHSIPDSEDGYAVYMFKWHNQEGYKAGVPALTASAKAGYAPSQYELGTLFMEGKLGKNKQAEAFRWLRLGADQNYPPALHNLGFLVQMRCMDPVKGNINKPKIPGTLLYDDKVRWASYHAGNELIQQAAELGFAPSEHSVGCTLLQNGQRKEAEFWLRCAADQGFKKAIDDYEKAFGKL